MSGREATAWHFRFALGAHTPTHCKAIRPGRTGILASLDYLVLALGNGSVGIGPG